MHNEYIQKVLTAGRVFLIVLSVFFIILSIAAIKATGHIGSGMPAANTITMSGEGEVVAVPDVAEFSFAVVETRETAEEAQAAAAEKSNAILAYLEEQDIDERDIQTTGYNVYPKYEWRQETITCVRAPCPQPPGEQVLVGYEVRQTVRVKVQDTEQAGVLLSGVGSLGASNISGLSFTIDDESELEREARQQAIVDAQEKAEALADDLGVRIIRIVGFSESGNYPVYTRGMVAFDGEEAAFDASGAPDIPVGENSIVSRVSITYEIR